MARKNERVETYIPDLEGEIWKPVEGYEDAYHVSNMGRVKSLDREILTSHGNVRWVTGRLLTVSHGKLGHRKSGVNTGTVVFSSCGEKIVVVVSRLVLKHFVSTPENLKNLWAIHRDGNVKNNCVKNLFWGTEKESIDEKYKRGNGHEGIKHPHAKITDAQVLEVRRRFEAGEKQCHIARSMQLTDKLVWKLVHKKEWKHI